MAERLTGTLGVMARDRAVKMAMTGLPNISSANYCSWKTFCEERSFHAGQLDSVRDSAKNNRSTTALSEVLSDPDDSTIQALNKAINLATVTPNERDFFLSLLPKSLRDPTTLMREASVSPLSKKNAKSRQRKRKSSRGQVMRKYV